MAEALADCRKAPAVVKAEDFQAFNKVVFFASWCPGCGAKLEKEPLDEKTLFVLIYDDVASGEKALQQLSLKRGLSYASLTCYQDHAFVLKGFFGMNELPFVASLNKAKAY